MKSTINAYIHTIPVYQKLYAGLSQPVDIAKQKASLPILTKQHVATGFPNNWMTPELKEQFQARQIAIMATSGTCGERMQLLVEKNWGIEEYQNLAAQFSRYQSAFFGCGRRALLTTPICSHLTCFRDLPDYEQRIRRPNTLLLNINPNPDTWSKADIERMCQELIWFDSNYIDADPIYLAKFLLLKEAYQIRTPLNLIQFITLSYEYCPQACLEIIKQHFSIPIVSLYGMTEAGYLYQQTPLGDYEKLKGKFSVDFTAIDAEQGLYELMLTSFKMRYMPLVNYATGDILQIKPADKAWISTHPDRIKPTAICGRKRDLMRNQQGQIISLHQLDHDLHALQTTLLFYQLQISANQSFTLRYTCKDNQPLTNEHAHRIQDLICNKLALTRNLNLQPCQSIAPESSGKYALIKRELSNDDHVL